MSGLPQLICQIATDADFRAHFQTDPRGTATIGGLTLSEEEWAVLMESSDLCGIEPANHERKTCIEPPLLDWEIGVPFTYAAFTH